MRSESNQERLATDLHMSQAAAAEAAGRALASLAAAEGACVIVRLSPLPVTIALFLTSTPNLFHTLPRREGTDIHKRATFKDLWSHGRRTYHIAR